MRTLSANIVLQSTKMRILSTNIVSYAMEHFSLPITVYLREKKTFRRTNSLLVLCCSVFREVLVGLF